jgi:hypothetical protein
MRLPRSQNPKNCQNSHRVAKVGLLPPLIVSVGPVKRLIDRVVYQLGENPANRESAHFGHL